MKLLVIQTAFIGDAILGTAVLEALHQRYPEAELHYLVKRGYESLVTGHPFLTRVLTLDKSRPKPRELLRLLRLIRRQRYDWVINLHRFASSGLLTALSGAPRRSGFRKNPFSRLFTERFPHHISADPGGPHEVNRNHALVAADCGPVAIRPRLYPQATDQPAVDADRPYMCLAPASVWFTKQYPESGWIELVNRLPTDHDVLLLGAPGDHALCARIALGSRHRRVRNLAGELSLLESAALMAAATMNFVNDSAPLHLASAVDAPVTAIFCSTVPAFGFGPLSHHSVVVETPEQLPCRPCGIHGKQSCPEGHFRCANISADHILEAMGNV